MNYENLIKEASQNGIYVLEDVNFESKANGLINGNVIGLNKNIKTTVQKKCVLAEELGHYYTTVGEIIDQSETANRKQEARARLWAYDRLAGLYDIVRAYKQGCHSLYDMADRLDVTEEFLKEALQCYKSKYGTHITIGNYVVYFEPSFSICELR